MEGAQGTKFIGGSGRFSRLNHDPSQSRTAPLTSVPSSLLGEGRSKQATLCKLPALPRLSHPSTPLQAEGLSRRVYPFIGLAIVGLVSLHGFAAVTTSLALGGAMALGVALVFIPLAEIDTPARNGVITAVPVIGGFVLALHPLWADGTIYGVASSVVITVLGGALGLLPWERISRYLPALSPIRGPAA